MAKKKSKEEVVKKPAPVSDEKVDKVEVLSQTKKMNKKYGKVSNLLIKQRDPYVPRAVEAKIREEILKMKAITANDIASKYDIRVSAVKKLLLTMEDEGKLTRVASSSRLKVFNPVSN